MSSILSKLFGISILFLFASTPVTKADEAEDAAQIANKLQSLVDLFDDLASFEELGDVLPLTSFSAAGEKGLELANKVKDTLGDALTGPFPDLAALRSAIENADLLPAPGATSVQYDVVKIAYDPNDPTLIDIQFDMELNRSTSFPISYSDAVEPIRLGGGGISIDLTLKMEFRLKLDVEAGELFFPSLPSIEASVDATGLTGFSSVVGFADVQVGGSATLNLDVGVDFEDPDDNGQLTHAEWTTTSLADLVRVGFREELGDEVNISLDLNSELVGAPGSFDASIKLIDADLTDGLAAPTVTLGLLDDFTNVSPSEVLTGLGSLAATIGATQRLTDVQIPFLDRSLGDVFEFAEPLISLIRQQSDAAIVCGTIQNDPPQGEVIELPEGTLFYCQATTIGSPAVVEWALGANVEIDNAPPAQAPATESIGTNPTASLRLKMLATGRPDVRIKFKELPTDTVFREVSRLFLGAEELMDKLEDLAGLDDTPSNVLYDPETKSLTFHLKKTLSPPVFGDDANESVSLDFADRLKEATNLSGLGATASAGATIDPSAALDVTFGVILDPAVAAVEDRFFIKVRTGPGEHEFQADVTILATVALTGRVGFLGVSVTGDGTANDVDAGEAFKVAPIDDTKPMLALDIDVPPGGIPAGGGLISDAILLGDLLPDLRQRIVADINIRMSGGLRVEASSTTPPINANATVSINWPDVGSGDPPIIEGDANFDAQFKLFDTDPSIFGLAAADTDGMNAIDTLTDTTHSPPFTAALVGRTLKNLTHGSQCVVTGFVGADQLSCVLSGGDPGSCADAPQPCDPNSWNAGNKYELVGNPFDLLSAILDNLDTIVSGVDALTGADPNLGPYFNRKLPLIGKSPEDLIAFVRDLENVLDEIRIGGLRIACTGDFDCSPLGVFCNLETGYCNKEETLQVLETLIENKLELPAEAISLEITDLPLPGGDGTKDLVIRLGIGRCTEKDTPNVTAVGTCAQSDGMVPKLELRANIGLDDLGVPGLVSVETEGDPDFLLEYAARAQLDLAFPLTSDLSAATVRVVDTSGITLAAAAEANADPFLTLSLGALHLAAAGVAKLGARFTLDETSANGTQNTPNDETFAVSAYVGALRARLEKLTSTGVDCGEITDSAGMHQLEGAACALLTLVAPGDPDPAVGVVVGDLSETNTWDAFATGDLSDLINVEALAWDLLLDALQYLVSQVDAILQGGGPNLKLPFVGSRLDGGAKVCSSLSKSGGLLGNIQSLISDLKALPGTANPIDVEMLIQDRFHNVLGDLLLDTGGNGTSGELADVLVNTICAGIDCVITDSLTDIEDVQIKFLMGEGSVAGVGCPADDPNCVPGDDIPFDLGIPGVPLGLDGTIHTSAGWALLVNFGLSRAHGPYLRVDDAEKELRVGASVALDGCTLKGTLAFLNIDGNDNVLDDPDVCKPGDAGNLSLELLTELDIQSGNPIVGLQQLTGGDVDLMIRFDAVASSDLQLRTSLNSSAQLPSVQGQFELLWLIASGELNTSDGSRLEFNAPDELGFNELFLDVGGFFSDFIKPLASKIRKATRPFDPVIAVIRAPIPIVTQLSELTGGPKVTFLTLLEAYNGGPLPMLEAIVDLIDFIGRIDSLSPNNVLIGLGPDLATGGSFGINKQKALSGPSTPDKAGELIENADGRAGLLEDITDEPLNCISFPFLEDSSQIFGLLLGQDVTLMRFDAGTMQAKAVVGPFSYCCIPVGPIPVGVFIEGSATLKGRFAMGYDTVGLRKVFNQGDPVDLLDGIFIDDLNSSGEDVPEISLIGEIRAGAGVDFFLVAGGVDGGVRMTVDLNLDDSPEPDGKLRLDEVIPRLNNPICLFEVMGKLEAFLGAWVRVGWGWFSKTWRVTIAKFTLLEFSGKCDPPEPAPARVEGGNLIVHIGPPDRRALRGICTDDTDECKEEEVIIRPLNIANTAFSVSMFGVTEDYAGVSSAGIIDVLGDSLNDVITLESGTLRVAAFAECTAPAFVLGKCGNGDPCEDDSECADACAKPATDVECIIPFTRKAVIDGGPGNDEIKSGEGNDVLRGGDGDDKITGNKGADEIYGGANDDILDGDAGNDTIYGDGGADSISGGPDDAQGPCESDPLTCTGDRLFGGEGDDTISGGPGTNIKISTSKYSKVRSIRPPVLPPGHSISSLLSYAATATIDPGKNPDGNDYIEGGSGIDVIEAHFGDDWAYGGGDKDKIDGGPGDDHLFGDDGDDVLGGYEGNDFLYGGAGHDLLDGDDADDPIVTEDGDDHLFGGSGNDQLLGRRGHDFLNGEDGNDALYGDQDHDDLIGGSGRDILFGGLGQDILIGDNGSIAAHNAADHADGSILALIARDNGSDNEPEIATRCEVALAFLEDPSQAVLAGNDNSDCLLGGEESDYLFGESGRDRMYGDGREGQSPTAMAGAHQDYMEGNGSADVMRGGIDHDEMYGNDGDDEMSGDSGMDLMFGGRQNDTMRGNQDDDYMEGNADNDTMFGDAGQDDMIGGSDIAGANDGSDTIHGNAGTDVILGDNGSINRPEVGGPYLVPSFNGATARHIQLHDVGVVGSVSALIHKDYLFGDAEADILYGQGGADEMHGGDGDDYMEGNDGADEMFGDSGNDDLVGGTGPINGDDQALGRDGYLDDADTMNGGDGFDVMAGDNAILRRTQMGELWTSNTFNDGVGHETRVLRDIDSSDTLLVSGADIMTGGNQDDYMYGQGQGDIMYGDAGDDWMEGNAGSDSMNGGADEDDMIGGTVQASVGDLGDVMHGDDAEDVMLGDNGLIRRPLDAAGQWIHEQLNTGAVLREITLLDVQTITTIVSPTFSGADTMFGDADEDRMFGQGGPDAMHGGGAFDYMEGNHDDDDMFGDDGEDDIIGGGSANNGIISISSVGDGLLDGEDEMHGGADGDVMVGDNARINRRSAANGVWLVDTNVQDVLREVQLFDIERVTGAGVDQRASGSDAMFGDDGRDLMFGQGNTQTDSDGDNRFDEDVADGRDNDRDGRESATSTVFDCGDGEDNDGDGLADAADSGCSMRIDEDGGGDLMHGGDHIDYMEGNHGSDWMFGDAGEDDMIGGSSSGNGLIGSGAAPTGLRDGDDVMSGGSDDDVMIADNGRIDRQTNAAGIWIKHTGFGFDLAVRVVTMAQAPDAVGTFGGDFMQGNDDHDEMYGQQGHDFMEGNNGQDAMLGDLGRFTNQVETGSRQRVISIPAPFFEETIYSAGTFTRNVELYAHQVGQGAEGHDVILGGDSRDSLHGCAGNDIINGDGDSIAGEDPVPTTDDEDHIFGGDGHDVMWGGRNHDHLWGGWGNDHLDVRPRVAAQVTAPDSPLWFTYGEPDHYQGLDIIYGGWDQDAMQANVAASGPPAADRLIDWVGGYNVYYVCPGAYGEGTITRQQSPHLRKFLQSLSEADGALTPIIAGTSGFRELGLVFPGEASQNSHPPHPDHPGHFTCDDGTVLHQSNVVRGKSPEPRVTPVRE